MPGDFRVLVLISGRGSNLKALIEQASAYRVAAVLSNNPEAGGLHYAREAGIPEFAFDRRDYPSLAALKHAIFARTEEISPDLVALAGFMQVVQPEFVRAYKGRMVNIHPSLLPKHPGLDTHRRVLAAGDTRHGCTVHFVDAGVDTGPLIAQAQCEICSGETEESAASKVLAWEHRIYPWVLNSIARGGIRLGANGVEADDQARDDARARGFILAAAAEARP